MVVASMHLGVWSWLRQSPELQKLNVRMGKKGDLSTFEHGMVVGARRAGLSISQSAQLLGPFLGFTKNGVKREKHPVCGSPVGENALLMLECAD